MAKEFAKPLYNSKAWKKCRAAYIDKRIAIDGGMCEKCRDAPGYIVHHVVALMPENIGDATIALNHDLLRYDCKACHDAEEDHFTVRTPLLVEFDDNGDVLPPFKGGEA